MPSVTDEIGDYPGLTDEHRVCNCGGCGRLLLSRRHKAERVPPYDAAPGDTLPPLVYRRRAVVWRGVVRALGFCRECDVTAGGTLKASRRAVPVAVPGGYAV